MAFDTNGCFETLNGVCPFGFNCADAWNEMKGLIPRSDNQTKTNTKPDTPENRTKEAPVTTTIPAPTLPPQTENPSPTPSGSNMSVIFAIIGAAIGVIAVAVIFLTLVRRSRAANDDDEEMISTSSGYKSGVRHSDVKPPVNFTQFHTNNEFEARSASFVSSSRSQSRVDPVLASSVASYYNQSRPISSPGCRRSTIGVARPVIPPGPSRLSGYSTSSNPMAPSATENSSSVAAPNSAGLDVYAAEYRTGPYVQNIVESPRSRRESYEF